MQSPLKTTVKCDLMNQGHQMYCQLYNINIKIFDGIGLVWIYQAIFDFYIVIETEGEEDC